MVELNKVLPLARMAVFGVTSLFSLIIFAISVHFIAATNAYRRGAYYEPTALQLATAIMTLLTLPAMYFLSVKRRGAYSSYIATEIGVCWFLWIMWVASAGSTVSLFWAATFCTGGVCSEAQALEAFAFLNWIIIAMYTTTLLVLAIMAHLRGHKNVWTSEVGHFDWAAASCTKASEGGVAHPVHTEQKVETGHIVQQGQQYQIPQQYPPQNSPHTTGGSMYVGAPVGGVPTSPQV
ncbi:hypothetical protein D9611_002896 [Ephemerocybe angulata]|uniref:MARVEL domain-containing protein n=1 Tax=Ephemerocybe angulata TaxID=980116 RepID=A0A8H5C8P7_9AGAR|nr:hypothetical protein D9611_002896 [Tulosesus angulatus]